MIGVFTPSWPANALLRDKYLHGIRQLESLGFRVLEGSLTRTLRHQGYRSGSPEERANEFMALVVNPEVHCLMSAIGGNNSASLVPFLDFEVIRAHPKIICGYSDVTSLHLSILAYSRLSTFYGPAVTPSFGQWPGVLPETHDSFLDAVQRHRIGSRVLTPPEKWSNELVFNEASGFRSYEAFQRNSGWKVLVGGIVQAPIIVANLDTLMTTAGTSYFPDLDGTVLLIEDADVSLAQEERNLRQLQLLGVFDRIAGLIVGKPHALDKQGAPFDYEDLIMEIVGPRNYPIIANFDCGHTVPMLTIAQLTEIRLAAKSNGPIELTIVDPMISNREASSPVSM